MYGAAASTSPPTNRMAITLKAKYPRISERIQMPIRSQHLCWKQDRNHVMATSFKKNPKTTYDISRTWSWNIFCWSIFQLLAFDQSCSSCKKAFGGNSTPPNKRQVQLAHWSAHAPLRQQYMVLQQPIDLFRYTPYIVAIMIIICLSSTIQNTYEYIPNYL